MAVMVAIRSTCTQYASHYNRGQKLEPNKMLHQVRPLYRYSATLLGASMWFFVGSIISLKAGHMLMQYS